MVSRGHFVHVSRGYPAINAIDQDTGAGGDECTITLPVVPVSQPEKVGFPVVTTVTGWVTATIVFVGVTVVCGLVTIVCVVAGAGSNPRIIRWITVSAVVSFI